MISSPNSISVLNYMGWSFFVSHCVSTWVVSLSIRVYDIPMFSWLFPQISRLFLFLFQGFYYSRVSIIPEVSGILEVPLIVLTLPSGPKVHRAFSVNPGIKWYVYVIPNFQYTRLEKKNSNMPKVSIIPKVPKVFSKCSRGIQPE